MISFIQNGLIVQDLVTRVRVMFGVFNRRRRRMIVMQILVKAGCWTIPPRADFRIP
jgi:hypothetical protein